MAEADRPPEEGELRGLAKVDWLFVFSCAAFNLIRVPMGRIRASRRRRKVTRARRKIKAKIKPSRVGSRIRISIRSPGDKPGTGTDRTYGPDGRAVKDIDTGHNHGAGDPHAHDWDWSGPKPRREPGRPLTPEEGGSQQRSILDWANDHKGTIITGTVVIGVSAAIVFTGGAAAPALALAF